jgi:GAF domain-containing protein
MAHRVAKLELDSLLCRDATGGKVLEDARLDTLNRYDVPDSAPEESFDRITRMTRKIFDVPITAITLIDGHRQWYKARVGIAPQEECRKDGFCNVAISLDTPLIVPDTLADARFRANPRVLGGPKLRFYAGAQLRTPDGYKIGTLCIADMTPNSFDAEQTALLCDLASTVMSERELRLSQGRTV